VLTIADDKIKAGMESAFRMAEAGEAALKNAAAMNNAEAEKDVPRDPELENLIRNLFAHKNNIEDKTPAINGKATKYNYRPTLKNMKLHRVNTILTNMRRYMKEEKANPDLNDVVRSSTYFWGKGVRLTPMQIIYCDSSRLNIPVNLESLKTLKSVADKGMLTHARPGWRTKQLVPHQIHVFNSLQIGTTSEWVPWAMHCTDVQREQTRDRSP
jgi:hypothetical protein